MRRPEGHNIKKKIQMKSLSEGTRNIMINEPENPEGLDQQKPEGSEVQKATSKASKHEHGNGEHAKNKQRRIRQKQNKRNLTITPKTYEVKSHRHTYKTNRRGGGATQDCDRRPLPRLRQKARAQGNWVNREHTKFESCYSYEHKLARVWTRTPPSGEPGEPRWQLAKLRTPSPKPEVEEKENITNKNQRRCRSYEGGIRSEVATNRRKTKHLMKQGEERREYRKQKSETTRGDWRRLATRARQLAKQPPTKAFND